ncbi:hypothetical protein [Leptolyngbya sp. AS-A5]|uniref:hypothetical protein n=1 Tax=Leptolyngbya sp. AS-A5 TaxID=2933919 RepID=UPI003299E73C
MGSTELNYAFVIVTLGVICPVLSIRAASQTVDVFIAGGVLALWLIFSIKTLLALRYASLGNYKKALEERFQQVLEKPSSQLVEEVCSGKEAQAR